MMTRYDTAAEIPVSQSNPLGLAGFICALAGWVTGGLLCPIGLVLSLIALGRNPKGFAIAGVVIGLLGSCLGLAIFVVFGAAILVALGITAGVAFLAMSDPDRLEITVEMAQIAEAVQRHERQDDFLPASLTLLGLDNEALTDPWGNHYVYTFLEEKPGFDVISYGKDGTVGTDDDIALTRLDEYWKAYFDSFSIEEDKETDTVRLSIGGRTIVLSCDEENERVELDLGDRTIVLEGDEHDGRISVRRPPHNDQPQASFNSTDSSPAESETVVPDAPEEDTPNMTVPSSEEPPAQPDEPSEPAPAADTESPS